MNILITGGTGFIGSHIAHHYLAQGHKVFITGKNSENTGDCEIISSDFHDNHVRSVIGDIDIVFHQAAVTDTLDHDRDYMLEVNFWRSRKLLDMCLRAGVRQFVYASSASVYGDAMPPYKEHDARRCLNVYAESKLLFDRYCEIVSDNHPHARIVGLRYSNVYGPREDHKGHARSMIRQLMQQMRDGDPKLFEWGEQKRDFVYIKDVVQANILAAQLPRSGVFNVGSGVATTFNQLVATLNDQMGLNRQIEYIPCTIKGYYQNHTVLDLTESKSNLGYEPHFSVEAGIADYIASL